MCRLHFAFRSQEQIIFPCSVAISKVKGTGLEFVIISEGPLGWLSPPSSAAEKAEVLPSVAKQFCSSGGFVSGSHRCFLALKKRPGYLFKTLPLRKLIRFHSHFSEMMCPSCLPNLLVCSDPITVDVVQFPSTTYYLSGFCPHIFFLHPKEQIKWEVL